MLVILRPVGCGGVEREGLRRRERGGGETWNEGVERDRALNWVRSIFRVRLLSVV